MNLDIQPGNRWCAAQRRPRFVHRAIQAEILSQNFREGEFTLLGAPLRARDTAPFHICCDETNLLVAIALYDSTTRPALPGGKNPPESVEIFFDPRHDHLGFFQFIINEDGSHLALTHLPYPEAHSTAFPHIELKSVESRREQLTGSYSGWSCHWVFARFAADEVFRYGDVVGFNICRSRLRAEMATIAGWGVNRLHWIEYGDWPSFWDAGCWTNAGQQEYWAKNSASTFRHCGRDLLRCAVRQARANGLEIFADLKVFDLAINNTFCRGYLKSSVVDIENRPAIAIPELAAHPRYRGGRHGRTHHRPSQRRRVLPEVRLRGTGAHRHVQARTFSRWPASTASVCISSPNACPADSISGRWRCAKDTSPTPARPDSRA
jgi:hypothetical protein